MERRMRTHRYRPWRSARVVCFVGIVIGIVLTVIVVTVVAVTVSNANRRVEGTLGTGLIPPSDVPVLTTPTTAAAATQPGLTTPSAPPTEPSRLKNVTLSFRAFTADRLEIVLNVTYQYHVSEETAQRLTATYGMGYESVLVAHAEDALKGRATTIRAPEFLAEDRLPVRCALYDAVRGRLEGTCCKPSFETLPEGCVHCSNPPDCTEGDLVDSVILWSFTAVLSLGLPG